jgi:hypothetical protein
MACFLVLFFQPLKRVVVEIAVCFAFRRHVHFLFSFSVVVALQSHQDIKPHSRNRLDELVASVFFKHGRWRRIWIYRVGRLDRRIGRRWSFVDLHRPR